MKSTFKPRYPTTSGAGNAGTFGSLTQKFPTTLPFRIAIHATYATVHLFQHSIVQVAMVWIRTMRSKPASAAKASASPRGCLGDLIASASASQRIEGLEIDAQARADFIEFEAGRVSLADLRVRILGRYGLGADPK
ncbi:antitoxin VbhA family protein [Paracoccus aestuariivivens]|uniref:antitoxin VbhA family protein n=1 Tax=Paracoccus aestuariivivens TaxID=1820333 RepID=UPI0012BAFDAC|nr:antitoxin VbhA family protein [Paracoccus aestuariivivens]